MQQIQRVITAKRESFVILAVRVVAHTCLYLLWAIFLGSTLADAQDISMAGDEQPGNIVNDPLAWLKQQLTCEKFLDQLKARYAPLGKYSELPEIQKKEVQEILAVACSEKFRHCKFSICPSSGDNPRSPTQQDQPVIEQNEVMDARITAENHLKEQYLANSVRNKEKIAKKIAEEDELQLVWKRFSMPSEKIPEKPDKSSEQSDEIKNRDNKTPEKPTRRVRNRARPSSRSD